VRALEAIADAVRSATASRIPGDARAFRAHVTIGRAAEPVRVPAAYRATVIDGRPIRVEALELVRSHLGAGAPRYERVASFTLGG
jgi:2'-5' RNA ligase